MHTAQYFTASRRAFIGFTLLAMFLLAGWTIAIAQSGNMLRRIRFERGRTTAVLKGRIAVLDSHQYVLRARAKQTMTVHLASPGNKARFEVTMPNQTIINPSDGMVDWSGDLPAAGDYQINLFTSEDRSVPYTLEVTVR